MKNRSKSLFLDSHSICRITTSQLKEQEVANEHDRISQGACPLPVQEKAPRAGERLVKGHMYTYMYMYIYNNNEIQTCVPTVTSL